MHDSARCRLASLPDADPDAAQNPFVARTSLQNDVIKEYAVLTSPEIRMATQKTSTAVDTATEPAAPRAATKRHAASSADAPAKAPRSIPVATDAIALPTPKQKLVRDTFTFPKTEYAVLRELKQRAAQLGRPAKKSEILRAGLGVLNAMSDAAFNGALAAVPTLKSRSRKDVKPAAGKAAAKPGLQPVRK